MFRSLHYPLITWIVLSTLSVSTTQAQDNIHADIGIIPAQVQLVMDGHNLPSNSVSFFVRKLALQIHY